MKNHDDKIYVLNSFGEDVEVKVEFSEYLNGGTAILLKSYETRNEIPYFYWSYFCYK